MLYTDDCLNILRSLILLIRITLRWTRHIQRSFWEQDTVSSSMESHC